MGMKTKPRKRYRPRLIDRNPVELGINRIAKLPAAECAQILEPVRDALRAMREGVGSEAHWVTLSATAQMATSIERQGVMRGLQGHLAAATASLQAIRQRAVDGGEWRAPALHLGEIDTLDEFVWLHAEQLQRLSRGELMTALNHAESVFKVSAIAEQPPQAPQEQKALAW